MDDQNQTLKYTLCPVQTLCYGRLWKYRTNILNRWQNYRKYVSFITIFRPEEYSLFLKTSTEVESTFPRLEERVLEPHNVSVDEDLREAAKQVEFHPELLEQFAIGGKEADALEKSKISSSGGSSLHQYRNLLITSKVVLINLLKREATISNIPYPTRRQEPDEVVSWALKSHIEDTETISLLYICLESMSGHDLP
ncbi:LOW QUALITY PROTEIN: hypothetical protein YC2023_104266 [Brassica napus]